MASNYRLDYDVDIVFCIDVTMSMAPIINTIKDNILSFYQDFVTKMHEKGKPVGNLRIKLVAFRDYFYDAEQAMLVTDFFDMKTQALDLRECVASIEANGGGDDPEDGLEALSFAIESDWVKNDKGKARHIIVVYSDDATHPLGFGKKGRFYPEGRPENFNELTEWWGTRNYPGKMNQNYKRLIMFTPQRPFWTNIDSTWNNTVLYPSRAGMGLGELDYDAILDAIINSV